MINDHYKYSAITAKIIGCAMTVHKTLGNGFQEVIYQRALSIEMRLAGIDFSREVEMPIYYREQQIGTRRVDFFSRKSDFSRIKSRHKTGRGSFCTSD